LFPYFASDGKAVNGGLPQLAFMWQWERRLYVSHHEVLAYC